MQETIFVCTSCDRNRALAPEEMTAGAMLARAVQNALADQTDMVANVREVACLSGCLKPCNVAFRGAGRYTYRFSRLVPTDAPLIVAFAAAYWAAGEGAIPCGQIAPELRAKLTVYTPPRGRW